MIWDKDGSRYCEVIGGVDLTATRRDWVAASPAFGAMQVPDPETGRKVWQCLEPEAVAEPEPVAEPTPEPPRVRDPQYVYEDAFDLRLGY